MYERIQPVVLVGGKSTRFGRDKLREPVGDGWLVDRPIAALREVFGRRVALVGNADPDLLCRGDLVVADRYPGAGPLGGVVSSLEWCAQSGRADAVFVLAGDLSNVTGQTVDRLVVDSANPNWWVVIAIGARDEPCVGLYRTACLGALRSGLGETRSRPLWSLIQELPGQHVRRSTVPVEQLRNVNRAEDLPGVG